MSERQCFGGLIAVLMASVAAGTQLSLRAMTACTVALVIVWVVSVVAARSVRVRELLIIAKSKSVFVSRVQYSNRIRTCLFASIPTLVVVAWVVFFFSRR